MVTSYFFLWLVWRFHCEIAESSMCCFSRSVLRDQKSKNGRQQHEDQRLHNSYEDFQKIKGDRNQPGKQRHHVRHCLQNTFARVNVSKKSKTQRNRSEQDRDNLKPTDQKENPDHEHFENARSLALRPEQMHQKSADAVRLK